MGREWRVAITKFIKLHHSQYRLKQPLVVQQAFKLMVGALKEVDEQKNCISFDVLKVCDRSGHRVAITGHANHVNSTGHTAPHRYPRTSRRQRPRPKHQPKPDGGRNFSVLGAEVLGQVPEDLRGALGRTERDGQ